MMSEIPKSLFLSHGGGPMPLLGDPDHQEMVEVLEQMAKQIPQPDAIVVISAHWEESVLTVTSGSAPALIYDYYGFPPESYEIHYPCPGEPDLAREVSGRLEHCGMNIRLDEERGLDHGVFVPLKIMYPYANIPCVQLSLSNTLDPGLHIDMGRALEGLHKEKVLVIGSGFSFHNLSAFFKPADEKTRELNLSFERWLKDICMSTEISEQQRQDGLIHWSKAPGASFCHPREEHLLPLHVCYGAAGGPGRQMEEVRIMNRFSSMYVW